MIKVFYTRAFLRQLKKLEDGLAVEVVEKIELFKNEKNHIMLKVHKLHGNLKDKYSFSVNYKVRIIFEYDSKSQIYIIAIDDHDIYK